ncbi:MAG: ABC transporter permease subunit, partial [Mesorhizobium sp.]
PHKGGDWLSRRPSPKSLPPPSRLRCCSSLGSSTPVSAASRLPCFRRPPACWRKPGKTARILLVALVTVFPMMVALVEGYAATSAEISQMLAAMGAGRWRIFWLARLPSAMPYFFTGLRISITYAVVGAIFAEYAGAAKGLGIYMLSAKNNFRPDLVLAAVAVSSTLTLALFGLAVLVQRLAMPWERADRKADASERRP